MTKNAQPNTAIDEIQSIMAHYIPDFNRKFSAQFQDTAIDEIRKEKAFEIKTARALVFGETGVGKTTTINFLLNNPIFPTSGELSCTQSLACGEHEGGLIFYDSPGLGDEEGLENVTRAALGITPLPNEPIDQITLIDITAHNMEGPDTFDTLSYDAFAGEIDADFYQQRQNQIVAKRFDLADFEAWAAAHFDFVIFVASSRRGLPTPIAKILKAFDEQPNNAAQLFKVFNVFDDQHRENSADLTPAIRKRYEQTLERSVRFGLSNADQWFVIDSLTGAGVAPLIEAFAEVLPVEVLTRLTQVVKAQYVSLIQERITCYFFDYVAHIASLVAVFPVDYADGNRTFLAFTIHSMATMGQFMFADQGNPIEDDAINGLIDELVADLQLAKQQVEYTKVVQKQKKTNPILKWIDRVGKNINPDFDAYDQFDGYEMKEQAIPESQTFALGGVDGVRLTLALGLTLYELYYGHSETSLNTIDIDSMMELNWRTVEAEMGYGIWSELIMLIKEAQQTEDITHKRQMAKALYSRIRPVVDISQI